MRTATFLLFVFSIVRCMAQTTPSIVDTITGNFDLFTTDELGNVYALRGDVLELYGPNGQPGLRNSVKTFGRITQLDAFYSLKPMLFSAEQGQLASLDNTLSLQGSVINLPRAGFPQVVLVCASVQNAYWFFDQRDMELIRVDAQLRPLAKTGRMDQLLGLSPEPVQMQELDNWLYVNSPKHGILVFDLFGTYYKTIGVLGAQRFEVRKEGLFYMRDGRFERYDLLSFATEPLPMPPLSELDALRDARVEQGHLYLLLHDRIVIAHVGTR